MAWFSGYTHRVPVVISQVAHGVALTNHPVELSIGAAAGGDFHLSGHCTDFPNDIRFTDNDGETELDYFIENDSADPITAWVEVADDLNGVGTVTIYCYYRKAGVSLASSAEDAFLFGDEFKDWRIQYTENKGYEPEMCELASGNIFLIYYDPIAVKVYKKTSTDGGETWSGATELADGHHPHCFCLGNNVYITYVIASNGKYNLKFKISTNSGVDWSAEKSIANDRFADSSIDVYISGETTYILVASVGYDNGNNDQIDIFRSDDDGDSWANIGTPVAGGGVGLEDIDMFRLSDDNLILGFEWEVVELAKSYLYIIKSADNGVNWGDNSPNYNDGDKLKVWNIADDTYDYEMTGFFYDDGGDLIFAAYTEEDDPGDTSYEKYKPKYKKSTDQGDSWGATTTLIAETYGIGGAGGNCFKTSGNKVLIANQSHWETAVNAHTYVTQIEEALTTPDVIMPGARWGLGQGKVLICSGGGIGNVARVEGIFSGSTVETGLIVSSYTGTDYTIKFRIMGQLANVRIAFRYTDVDNHYLWAATDAYSKVYKMDGGVGYTQLDDVRDGVVITADTWHMVEIRVSGTSIKVYIDDVLYNDFVDETFASGNIALSCSGALTYEAFHDFVTIRTAVSPEPSFSSAGAEESVAGGGTGGLAQAALLLLG